MTVGDYVECRQADSETVAVEAVLPRKTLLFRSDEWRVKELAANVDLVAVVFASRPTFNPWFVWKAVVAAKTAGIDVVAIRNKADLTQGRRFPRRAARTSRFPLTMRTTCSPNSRRF